MLRRARSLRELAGFLILQKQASFVKITFFTTLPGSSFEIIYLGEIVVLYRNSFNVLQGRKTLSLIHYY